MRLVRQRWIWVLLGAFLIECLLEWIGAIRPIDAYVFDTMFWINQPKQSDRIVLVVIDDDAYAKHFGRRSPLDAATVLRGLRIIAQAEPAVIGVDLVTAEPSFAICGPPNGSQGLSLENVVWGRTAEEQAAEDGDSVEGESVELHACDDILGGRYQSLVEDQVLSTTPRSGIAKTLVDPDGIVRRYARYFRIAAHQQTKDGSEYRFVPSFPWEIVTEYRKRASREAMSERLGARIDELSKESREKPEPGLIEFSLNRDRYQRIRFSNLLKFADRRDWSWKPLKGKIVLLGGTYRSARDFHATPVGQRDGVELLADIIDMECEGTSVHHVGHAILVALHLLPACLLWFVHRYCPPALGLFLSVPLILVGVVFSYLVFHNFAYLVNFTVVPLGMWIHILLEGPKKH
jgi:hypothetical protein